MSDYYSPEEKSRLDKALLETAVEVLLNEPMKLPIKIEALEHKDKS